MCRWVYICSYNKVSNDVGVENYYLFYNYILFVKVSKILYNDILYEF